MQAIPFDNSRFAGALLLLLSATVLAILTSGGSNPNSYVVAFSSNGLGIGGRVPQRAPSMSAGRGDSINEWVSYLEEEFNRSGDNKKDVNNNSSNSKNCDKDDFRPALQQRSFQTSVTTHTNAIEFLDQIDTAPPNDLTVVLFFAHYCKTCHRTIVPFKQLANNYKTPSPSSYQSQKLSSVRFVRFETSVLSPKQFQSLGIDRVPFLHIYRNGICVSSFSATQKTGRASRKIVLRPRVLEHIDACQRRSLTDWLAFRERHDAEIEANKAARARIREASDTANGNVNSISSYDDDNDEEERWYQSVRTLTSESDLLRLLRGNKKFGTRRVGGDDYYQGGGDNNIVVVMFHSRFDASCVRAQHKFRKIACELQQQQQKEGQQHRSTASCTMARIEASVLPDKTLQLLGIERYPHIQIYWNSSQPHNNKGSATTKECVASFSIPRSFLLTKMLHQSLDAIDQRTPEEWAEFYNQHREEIESQQLALEGIVREREQQL